MRNINREIERDYLKADILKRANQMKISSFWIRRTKLHNETLKRVLKLPYGAFSQAVLNLGDSLVIQAILKMWRAL